MADLSNTAKHRAFMAEKTKAYNEFIGKPKKPWKTCGNKVILKWISNETRIVDWIHFVQYADNCQSCK